MLVLDFIVIIIVDLAEWTLYDWLLQLSDYTVQNDT